MSAQITQYEHIGLRITFDAPDCLPQLPAAVEVAAYRIIQEALTNVVRHANAHFCLIRLTPGETLQLEIKMMVAGSRPIVRLVSGCDQCMNGPQNWGVLPCRSAPRWRHAGVRTIAMWTP